MRLRHVRPSDPGRTRLRHGRGFRYLDTEGRPLRDPAVLERVRELTIPPAWREVWICPAPNGHLQAVGTDGAGRRQYLCHHVFRAEQERAKHDHVLDAAARLPRLRRTVEVHLAERGLTGNRALATAARLLDLGFPRVGSERYTEQHRTYGLTTLLREHTRCGRDAVTLAFPGKHGREQVKAVADPAACRAVRAFRRRRGGGEHLLVHGRHPDWHEATGEDLNAYLREHSGAELTAKDFRTWHATVPASVGLAVSEAAAGTAAARRRAVSRTVREVADYLGNTPSVCRAGYVSPRVVELYEEGVTIAPAPDALGDKGAFGVPATQGRVEQAVLHMLRTGSRPPAPAD